MNKESPLNDKDNNLQGMFQKNSNQYTHGY